MSYISEAPNEMMLLRGEWSELHQHHWPMRSRVLDDSINFHGPVFRGGGYFILSIAQSRGATYIKFGDEIGQSLAHFRFHMLLRVKTRAP